MYQGPDITKKLLLSPRARPEGRKGSVKGNWKRELNINPKEEHAFE